MGEKLSHKEYQLKGGNLTQYTKTESVPSTSSKGSPVSDIPLYSKDFDDYITRVRGDDNPTISDNTATYNPDVKYKEAPQPKMPVRVSGDSRTLRYKTREQIMMTDNEHQIKEELTNGTVNYIPAQNSKNANFPATANVFSNKAGERSPLEHSYGLFSNEEIDSLKYNTFARHSVLNPNDHVVASHEILFFTKFDLHITKIDDDYDNGKTKSNIELIDELAGDAFFRRLMEEDNKNGRDEYKIIRSLQKSAIKHGTGINNSRINPFINLLTYTCKGGLNLPSVTATTVDTPSNAYGTNYEYRGSGEANDDSCSFSLEFVDNKDLDVYRFFKAYDKYETLKSHGAIPPIEKYVINRILYDQCGLYKFTLSDDYSRILHYAYYWGVFPVTVPREAFDQNIDNGLTYTVDFKAAFVDDLDPNILVDFNQLTKKYWNACKNKNLPIRHGFDFYRTIHDKSSNDPFKGGNGFDYLDNELVHCPHITRGTDNNYYLIWR